MRATAALLFFAALLLPAVARAYDHQATFELGIGLAHSFGTPPYDENGPAIVLGGSIGLGDTFTLRGALTWAGYPGASFTQVGIASAEVVYMLDLLEIVPYAGLGIDAVGRYDGTATRGDFAAHGVIGFDWLFTRDMYVGIEARPFVVLTALDTVPVQLVVTAQYGVVLGL